FQFSYDVKTGGKFALDFITAFQNYDGYTNSITNINCRQHAAAFGHGPETVIPTAVTGWTGGTTPHNYPIPAPGDGNSYGGRTAHLQNLFNGLPSSLKMMSMYDGYIMEIRYGTQADLTSTGNVS